MAEKSWWESHALLLGKLTGNLLTIELSARLMVAKREAGGDLKKTRPLLPQLKEGDWVEITPLSNNSDMRVALEKYNSCVRRSHPELTVDVDAIVFLRDALAHGRAFGVTDPEAGPYLRLLKFGRTAQNNKVQVTSRVDMTKDWFDSRAQMLSEAVSKVAKALDFEEKDLGAYSDLKEPEPAEVQSALPDDIGFKMLTPDNWLRPDPTFLKTAPITVEDFFRLALTMRRGELDLPEAIVPADGWLQAVYRAELHRGVPLEIRRLFAAARGMFAYGYCFYPLCTLASEQVLRGLEAAISYRCRGSGAPSETDPLQRKIDWLIEQGVLSEGQRKEIHSLRTLRNSTSHPKHQMLVVPQLVGQMFLDLASMINGLFKRDGSDIASGGGCGMLATKLSNGFMWDELDLRILTVEWCFRDAKVEIAASSDLYRLLEQAKAGHAIGSKNDASKKLHPDMGKAIATIWRLANTFQILSERKISFAQHLKVMKRGDTEFGQKDEPGKEKFKDFELELYVAALLCDRTARPVQLHEPGHPFDITFGDLIDIECKHPSSESKIAEAITECGKALRSAGRQGSVILGMEDVLELGQIPLFNSPKDVLEFAQARFNPVLQRRVQGWRTNFEAYPEILSIYFMGSVPVFLNEGNTASFTLYPLTMPGFVRDLQDPPVAGILKDLLTGLQ